MLPKKLRLPLRQQADFFRFARREYGKYITIFYAVSQEISQGAVIVPKKILSKATQRNKLKRQLQNILTPFLNENEGLNIVVVAKKEAQGVAFIELQKDSEKTILKVIK